MTSVCLSQTQSEVSLTQQYLFCLRRAVTRLTFAKCFKIDCKKTEMSIKYIKTFEGKMKYTRRRWSIAGHWRPKRAHVVPEIRYYLIISFIRQSFLIGNLSLPLVKPGWLGSELQKMPLSLLSNTGIISVNYPYIVFYMGVGGQLRSSCS